MDKSNKESIQVLKETVDAVEQLAAPHRKAFIISNIIHLTIELALIIVLGMMIYFAYMTPESTSVTNEYEQNQDFENQTQSNNSSNQFVTSGE